MAAFQLVTMIAALAIFATSCSANTMPGSSGRTRLLTRITEILNQATQSGGIDVTTLRADVTEILDLAVSLRDSLPDSGSPLAVALNNLVNAAHVFLGVSDSDAAALSGPFQNLTGPLHEVQDLLIAANGGAATQGAALSRRKRRVAAADNGCCHCHCDGCCCHCHCGCGR